ncbi:hypothetical protein HG531_012539 [Fusarium graminearum]|nr:hypothetical protein HG531_012539 [Fusarium graminearum]
MSPGLLARCLSRSRSGRWATTHGEVLHGGHATSQAAARLVCSAVFETPIHLARVLLGHLGSFQCLDSLSMFKQLFVAILFGGRELASHLAFYASSFVKTDVRETFLSPYDFSEFYMFEDHVNLLEFGVIDDFEEGDYIGVADLFQDGDLLFRLVLGRLCRDLSETSLLGEPWNNLDGDVFTCLEVPGQLDFAVHAAANFFDHFILVDEFPACSGI